MNRRKVLAGLIGLAIGFAGSFYWARSVNRSQAGSGAPASAMMPGSGMPQGMPSGQGPQMNQVRDTIEQARKNPTDFEAQLAAAEMYLQIGRADEAKKFLDIAYGIKTVDPRYYESAAAVAQFYFNQKDYAGADRWYRRALDMKPNDPEATTEYAATFIERQPADPDKAIQLLQSALKSNPGDAHALGHLVEAYLLKKDARGADEAMERLRQAAPGTPRTAALKEQVEALKAGRPVSIPEE